MTVALVVAVMDASARIVPTMDESVPSVAELPTCQNTLQGSAPLVSTTVLFDAVINVAADLKTKTASGSPCASRVRVPVIPRVVFP
jgi:hypothetical protein